MKKKGFLKHGEFEQDFELNIASIIDCFVVLIAFVLVSTSFFSIGIIDAEVAGSSDAVAAAEADSVLIEMKADHSMVVRSSKSSAGAVRISGLKSAGKAKAWDLEKLAAALQSMKERLPELRSAIVVADNSVAYRDVMASMEAARGQVPNVNLGGF